MDPGPKRLCPLADLLGAQVLLGPGEHLDHREAGRGHPLTPIPQPLRTDFDCTRHAVSPL
ncbi:hypothetical protein GCM10029976_054190 [Kribbella albertanoniae]